MQTDTEQQGFTTFDTAVGRCLVAWSAAGITAMQLPQSSLAKGLERIAKRGSRPVEMPPPETVRQAIAEVSTVLRGSPDDLSAIALDMRGLSDFDRQTYETTRIIPFGSTRTYGEIAKSLGDVAFARDVGRAMATNPFAVIVPCHRVLAAGNKPGGFSARGGTNLKLRMLAAESAYVHYTPSLFDTAV